MLKSGDAVLVAVSGGPDSVFLLHALQSLRSKLKLGRFSVCNLDHGLRGDESKEDSRFAKNMCGDLGVEFLHKTVDLRTKRSNKLSTEELARETRYKFFKDAATKTGASVIATGHTLDDQAETILMRLVKGSSLRGMAGIAPVREEGLIRFIRPLIELEKDEIIRYLDARDISYRTDRTNLEPIYFRNVVRREIIPFLERYNPRLKRVLSNLSEHLREDFEFIDREKSRASERMTDTSGTKTGVELKDIIQQPKAIQKEILRDLLDRAGGEVKSLSFRHWKEMEALIKHKDKGSSVDLPGGVRITRTARTLELYLI